MKKSIRNIVILASFAVLLISAYQVYWLSDIYSTLQRNLQKDIVEAMRSSDFAEINHRVEQMKNESYGGKMDVTIGADNNHDKVTVENTYQPHEDGQTDADNNANDNRIPYDDFGNVLRNEEDVFKVGLYFQKSIHTGLDALRPIDVAYYDSVLVSRLDLLGVSGRHLTLFLQKSDSLVDTLQALGSRDITKADLFRMEINSTADQEYVLLVEKSLLRVPKQMRPAILFSLFTLLVLIVAFWYIINMLKKMDELDRMKTDFTHNITHELKTPIAVAYAANNALLNFGIDSDPDKLKQYLEISQDQLTTLNQMVEQILSLNTERRESMKLTLEPIKLMPLVEKLVNNHRLNAKKEVAFSVVIPDDFSVVADLLHLTNILNNLIDNAVKYSNQEVAIAIEAKALENEHKVISVADNGIGIAHEQQRFVFDKFYRVPHGNLHETKGYGLGLYYVKSMMDKFHGKVSLKSKLGKGTTIKLEFNE